MRKSRMHGNLAPRARLSPPVRTPLTTILCTSLLAALPLLGCGGRELGAGAGNAADASMSRRPDGAVARVDVAVTRPDSAASRADAVVARADVATPRPDALAPRPDAAAPLPPDVFPQQDDPRAGVISGSVVVDPAACPTIRCGSAPGDDCKGELFVYLRDTDSAALYGALKAAVDLRRPAGAAPLRVPYRFKGLAPGTRYRIAAHLAESGRVAADGKPRAGDPYRAYYVVEVPPAGTERRHDIALDYRLFVKPTYAGTREVSVRVSLASSVRCDAAAPARDCAGTLDVAVVDYGSRAVETRAFVAVDLRRDKTVTVTLPDALPSRDAPRALYVVLHEAKSASNEVSGGQAGDLAYLDEPLFLAPVCRSTPTTIVAEVARVVTP